MVKRVDSQVKPIIGTLMALIVISLPAAAQQMQASAAVQPSASKVLFLEHNLIANGSIVQGETPQRSVNYPTYWYNENTKQLHGRAGFMVNSSLLVIFGDALTLKGDWGSGTGNKLYGIYSLPSPAGEAYIYAMDARGYVLMHANKRSILLKPGESYGYFENKTITEQGAVIDVVYGHTYVNHGLIDKKQISGGLVSPKIFF